ncbi:MAG TPA: PEP-CTERM sorting domain-containing protein [Bryobacteraceae bacterium]|jgi:hypothetical protein|nr:PEP-CTERM sorting domain-containing protein [Bryobacteraceae bacterium]
MIARTLTALWGSLLFAAAARAGTIYFDSMAGLNVYVYATGSSGTTVAITPHPLWKPDHPVNPGDPADHSAVWISYADTGYQGANFQPYMGASPVMRIGQTFISGAGLLTLYVWADDTAIVTLDGSIIGSGAFTPAERSGQYIGFRDQTFGIISTPISAGAHTLTFDVFQVGTATNTTLNPFGILFTGTAPGPADPAPEPASLALIGGGLIGLAAWRRRRCH